MAGRRHRRLPPLIPEFPTLANVNDQTPFFERVWRSTLPALTLTLVIVAHMMRMTRAAHHQPARQPLYRDGAPQGPVAPHASSCATPCPMPGRRSSPSIAFNLAYLVVGVVVVEVVFVYPGIGQLMVDAVSRARHAGGAGLRPDLRRHLYPPQSLRRHHLDHHQSAAAASAMTDRRRPRARRRHATRQGTRAARCR